MIGYNRYYSTSNAFTDYYYQFSYAAYAWVEEFSSGSDSGRYPRWIVGWKTVYYLKGYIDIYDGHIMVSLQPKYEYIQLDTMYTYQSGKSSSMTSPNETTATAYNTMVYYYSYDRELYYAIYSAAYYVIHRAYLLIYTLSVLWGTQYQYYAM